MKHGEKYIVVVKKEIEVKSYGKALGGGGIIFQEEMGYLKGKELEVEWVDDKLDSYSGRFRLINTKFNSDNHILQFYWNFAPSWVVLKGSYMDEEYL